MEVRLSGHAMILWWSQTHSIMFLLCITRLDGEAYPCVAFPDLQRICRLEFHADTKNFSSMSLQNVWKATQQSRSYNARVRNYRALTKTGNSLKFLISNKHSGLEEETHNMSKTHNATTLQLMFLYNKLTSSLFHFDQHKSTNLAWGVQFALRFYPSVSVWSFHNFIGNCFSGDPNTNNIKKSSLINQLFMEIRLWKCVNNYQNLTFL